MAEVSELIGAQRRERTYDRATHRIGYRLGRWDTRTGKLSCRSQRSVRARTSRASCSRATAASRRLSAWCSRTTSAAFRLGASISSSRGSGCASVKARCRGSPGLLDEQVTAFRVRQLKGR